MPGTPVESAVAEEDGGVAAEGFAQEHGGNEGDDPKNNPCCRSCQAVIAMQGAGNPSADDEHGGVEQVDGHHLPAQECACGRLPSIGKAPHETAQQHSDRKPGAAVDRESVDEKPVPVPSLGRPQMLRKAGPRKERTGQDAPGRLAAHAPDQALHPANHNDGDK